MKYSPDLIVVKLNLLGSLVQLEDDSSTPTEVC